MRFVFGLIALAATCLALYAASQAGPAGAGRLEGVVRDQSGAAVPGALVTLKRLPSGPTVTRTTSGTGRYLFDNLAAGEYEVNIQRTGFIRLVSKLQLGEKQRLARDFTLAVGEVHERIQVDAAAPALNTSMSVAPGSGAGFGGGRFSLPPRAFNTEEYGVVDEEGFRDVRTSPLSTFSADVDTASYTNVRRFLREGKMPPKDAVRIEEMLNFFTYDYPAPPADQPFSTTLELAACPWAKGHQVVHIGLRTAPVAAANLPPARLTFLLDVSGSMMPPNKLPLLKRSLALLAEQLRAKDKVAIVVYAGAAGVVLEPTSGADQGKILDALERLQAGGSTAGAAGIRLAYQTARAMYENGALNRVILATDGDFNIGTTSDGELKELIERERDSGVFLTALGFGYGNLKDAKLEMLARNGNGNYAYIDTILEARRALVEQMGATLLTVAKDVKLQVEFNPAHVKSYRLIGYENRRLRAEDFKNDKKDAGDLGAGHSVTALYEIIPAGSKEPGGDVDPLKYQTPGSAPKSAQGELLTLKLRYKDPDGSQSREFARVLKSAQGAASADFRFALAVAEFGLLLRDSEFKGAATHDNVVELASTSLGKDDDGRRAEFLSLVKQVRGGERLRSSR